MLPLADIRRALGAVQAKVPEPSSNLAAVAMVLAGDPADLQMCFILRATRADDRWSGQMALPGGRAEAHDATAAAVAMRETTEEVGLQLDAAEVLGALPPISLRPAGGELHALSPFTFYLGPELAPLQPNEEVAEAFWIPLTHLWDAGQRTMIDWVHEGRTMRFPGIAYRGQTIWGLTYRVLTTWAERLGRPFPGGGQPPFDRG